MVPAKKISKSVTAIIPLLLEMKVKKKSTELSIYIWELKNSSLNYDLKWYIAHKAQPYTGDTRKCNLCLTEKLAFMKADPKPLLNTRDEFVSRWRNMNKFTLKFFNKKRLINIFVHSF